MEHGRMNQRCHKDLIPTNRKVYKLKQQEEDAKFLTEDSDGLRKAYDQMQLTDNGSQIKDWKLK